MHSVCNYVYMYPPSSHLGGHVCLCNCILQTSFFPFCSQFPLWPAHVYTLCCGAWNLEISINLEHIGSSRRKWMTSGNQLEFLQFTSYTRYFLVEILIETCSKGFSFGKYSNLACQWKIFKIDPKLNPMFCYIKLPRSPSTKNSTENCEGTKWVKEY